jgi:hypothetical protein
MGILVNREFTTSDPIRELERARMALKKKLMRQQIKLNRKILVRWM